MFFVHLIYLLVILVFKPLVFDVQQIGFYQTLQVQTKRLRAWTLISF